MTSRKKRSFVLLMVVLFVFLTACGSEKEPETIVQTTEEAEGGIEETAEDDFGTFEIQSVEGWKMEEEFPYAIQLYDTASEALEHASDNKLIAVPGESGRVNFSYYQINEDGISVWEITRGIIVEINKEVLTGRAYINDFGDIQTFSIDMEKEMDMTYEVMYPISFRLSVGEYSWKYISFQIE